MKIKEYLKNLLERYSFHSIAWIFWILLLTTYILILAIKHSNIDVELGDAIGWYIALLGPMIFPVIAILELFIFLFLLKKEKLNINFRIKNYKFLDNPIYKGFICISSILSWLTIIYLIGFPIFLIINSSIFLSIFIIITCPILIVMGLIYLIVSKKFLS